MTSFFDFSLFVRWWLAAAGKCDARDAMLDAAHGWPSALGGSCANNLAMSNLRPKHHQSRPKHDQIYAPTHTESLGPRSRTISHWCSTGSHVAVDRVSAYACFAKSPPVPFGRYHTIPHATLHSSPIDDTRKYWHPGPVGHFAAARFRFRP